MSSLKSKTLNGLFWSLADSFGAYFIRFGFSIAIARTLSPSDYGLIGMIIIFIAIGNILTESGFSMALIQKKNATNADFSTIFYFNLMVSIIIYWILFFSAHFIADFYNEPILVNVIRISALTIILDALSTIQTVILSKELNFKKLTYINWVATIISGITGVVIAYNGFAVWALVFQTIAGTTIRLIGLWLTIIWRPTLIFDWKSFKQLYKYGYKIFLSGISDTIFTNIYFPLIGKYFSVAQLGYYTNANSFSGIFVKQTAIAYGRVLFPSISLIQDDKERLSKSYVTIFRLLSFIMFPVSVIAFISCPAFVALFLTAKWLPTVPYMQLLLIEGFFFALYMLNQHTITAIGFSGLLLKIEMFKKGLLFISLLVLFQYGIRALIIGQLLSSFITFLCSLFYTRKKLNYSIKSLLSDFLKLIVISVFIFKIDQFILSVYILNSGFLLLSEILFLSSVYLIFIYILKVQALNDLCLVFSKIIPEKICKIIQSRYLYLNTNNLKY